MMDCDPFLAPKVCKPTEAKSEWTTGFFWRLNVLMKTLQRCDSERLGREQLRLAHHLSLVCTVAVKCD